MNTVEYTDIQTFITEEYLTGYRLAKKVNEVLEHFELKSIPPQMVYNYIKKGFIPTTEVNGQALVTNEDAVTWVHKYVSKKLS